MRLGNNLLRARKKGGYSQEEAAGRLGVSRQTVSKWETGETVPDVKQAQRLAQLYGLTLDELLGFDAETAEIERVVASTSEEAAAKIDWSKLWGEKYPVLNEYRGTVNVDAYAAPLRELLARLRREYGYSELDAFLVLKDILAQLWTGNGG